MLSGCPPLKAACHLLLTQVVERVNKLVFVRPLKTRYDAAQGDVVVGRVTEVSAGLLSALSMMCVCVCVCVYACACVRVSN